MTLSILIVNYNGRNFLEACLEAIRRYVYVDHEVIVVDNASTDGSREIIRQNCPEVCLIPAETNLGFAKGNNLAAKNAVGTYLLLLNTDTKLLSDIQPALNLLETCPDIGTVGAMMYGKNHFYRSSVGHFPSLFKLFRLSSIYNKKGFFRTGQFPTGQFCSGYPVEWVEASFFLTRASLWRAIGGFDENYFMYGEEMDYCQRTLNKGFKTVYCPEVKYFHQGGYVISRFPFIIQALKRYHQKHSGFIKRASVSAILNGGLIARCIYYGAVFLAKRSEDSKNGLKASWRALLSLL